MKKKTFGFLPLITWFMLSAFTVIYNSGIPANQEQYDGPYVLYKDNRVFVNYITRDNMLNGVYTDSLPLSQKKNIQLRVNTDLPGNSFLVRLKDELQNEEAEYRRVNKQFILSDIEGNFGAFRKLLQGNGVIDQDFNWTFGNGHLVLGGDFFDRGQQVTEVLWLIYSLEDKAKAAGGYVHFILGNHEIMNLSMDLRYLHPKYIETDSLLHASHDSLYGVNSELGRWLRTKNVIEKIGDNLVMHGGISAELNQMDISVPGINKLARPFYADTTYKYPDNRLNYIFDDLGPFWYRGYYKGTIQATPMQIDSTLEKFRVRHIITGHTIVSDTISVWFGGKLFNTDTHHAEGKSEALFMEGGNYYRTDPSGKKLLLRNRNM